MAEAVREGQVIARSDIEIANLLANRTLENITSLSFLLSPSCVRAQNWTALLTLKCRITSRPRSYLRLFTSAKRQSDCRLISHVEQPLLSAVSSLTAVSWQAQTAKEGGRWPGLGCREWFV